jgi:hypothetical protein
MFSCVMVGQEHYRPDHVKLDFLRDSLNFLRDSHLCLVRG